MAQAFIKGSAMPDLMIAVMQGRVRIPKANPQDVACAL
jgi:hypothetical protein